MKSPIATLALFGSLAAGSALALAQTQGPAPASGGSPPRSPVASTGKADATAPTVAGRPARDPKLFPSATSLPDPTPAEELGKPTIALPNEPIEPWLLTKEHGPFMVLAKTFRGPESEKMALALAKELKFKHNLPAYILRSKDFPGKSNIRGVPPTADPLVTQANISSPEKYRTYDEAAVLVGNLKTEKDQVALLHQVKKIKPDCLNNMPHMFKWREGLSTALRTTNPYVAAQYLYPHKHDQLIVQMNKGSHSVSHCPDRYTLQVAEFTGRSTFNEKDEQFLRLDFLKKSPLATAADDAERLAAKLAKDPDIQRLGQPIYVFHDRRASRVYVGSFNAPMDPSAVKVREELVKLAVPLMDAKRPTGHVDQMIVPAGMLTDLKDIKANFQG
jgi:hypothetical protein